MIKVGDRLPEAEFITKTTYGPQRLTTDALFKGRKVVLFGVPGAFTPTCSMNHLPGFVNQAAALKAKGVDAIACVAVNDVHVMDAWGKHAACGDHILMLADGNGNFARKTGLNADYSASGMGHRSKRFSMVVDDGVVKVLNVEDKPGVNVSGADTVLKQL